MSQNHSFLTLPTHQLLLPDESMDVDPNYDPSDFLKLPGSIKKERPDHDPNDEQQLNYGDNQIDQSYDEHHQYDPTQLQPHQMKAEIQPYEMQQLDNQNYDDGTAGGQEMYQQHQHIVMDGDQQHYMMNNYDPMQQQQHPQEYGHQPAMMNVADNLVYQNVDESGRVMQMEYQPPNTDDGLGVGIDDDLAVSDSDDEDVLNAGDPPQQQFEATGLPEPPAAVFAKQETALDVEPDDDGGDLWF